MKYKAWITDTDKIFWTKNSVDKPSKDYFLNIMSSINWESLGNITPNFVNQFNGTLMVSKATYTYLKIQDLQTNEIKYFSIDSINKILSNGYIVDITLDVFTTYTLYFYESLKNYPIFINRTTAAGIYAKNKYSQLIPDNLISFENATLKSGTSSLVKQTQYWTTTCIPDARGHKIYGYVMKPGTEQDIWELAAKSNYATLIGVYKDSSVSENNPDWFRNAVFDVYQDTNGDYYYFPIFSPSTNCYCDLQTNLPQFGSISGNRYYPRFDSYHVESIRLSSYWISKYKGRYTIPNWDMLINTARWIVIENRIRDTGHGADSTLFGFILPAGIINLKDSPEISKKIPYDGVNYVSRNSKACNTYYMSKVPQPGSDIPIFNCFYERFTGGFFMYYWITSPNNSFQVSFVFNENWGAELFNYFASVYECVKIIGFETMPTNTDSYRQYLAGVQSQQNTNLKIAKQQQTMGIINSVFSGATGIASAVMTGNVIGGISSAFNAGTGIFNAVNQYRNTKRQIDAANADKQRTSTANNIVSSNRQANYWNAAVSKILPYGSPSGPSIPFNYLNFPLYLYHGEEAMININNIIWESGFIIKSSIILSNFISKNRINVSFFDDYVNSFVYWDIEVDTDYVKVTYPNYNNELVEAISATLNNPVRFWKTNPNYLLNLTIDWNEV